MVWSVGVSGLTDSKPVGGSWSVYDGGDGASTSPWCVVIPLTRVAHLRGVCKLAVMSLADTCCISVCGLSGVEELVWDGVCVCVLVLPVMVDHGVLLGMCPR